MLKAKFALAPIKLTQFLIIMVLVTATLIKYSALPASAQRVNEVDLKFTLTLSTDEVSPDETVDLIIEVNNSGNNPVEHYTISLFLTQGLTLSQDPRSRNPYEPLLTDSLTLAPGEIKRIVVPLYVLETASAHQSAALLHQTEDGVIADKIVAQLEIPIAGVSPQLDIQADYAMPIAPTVTCISGSPLSDIGTSVNHQVIIDPTDFSEHTQCNKFSGDWILDIPNVNTNPPNTSAEDFFDMTADLIKNTKYTFSMSTLWFNTHNETDERNLVKHYLAPAIYDLHIHTPSGGPYPLLRFVYSPGGWPFAETDTLDEVYADLISELAKRVPDRNYWKVSIAVVEVGQAPANPWNHSKIAVRDYREAIVGGMNWHLSYLADPPLHDLSIKVEGEAAKEAGVFFDKLWRRGINPSDLHSGSNCKVSWAIFPSWDHDCALEQVPEYVSGSQSMPKNKIPNYVITENHNVFSLGRGHTDFSDNSPLDQSADHAIIAAFGAAQDTIYLSQHQLTNSFAQGKFTPQVKDALIGAIVDPNRKVTVKIAISEPWGTTSTDLQIVFDELDNELDRRAKNTYSSSLEIEAAHCRLEFGLFRRSPSLLNIVYNTHGKFFMIDEQVFYIGSQNLYPSGIGEVFGISELNEFGYLIDDKDLTTAIKQQYWDPTWRLTKGERRLYRSKLLPIDVICRAKGPKLLSPTNGSSNISLKPTFSWTTSPDNSSDNTYYEIELSSSPMFLGSDDVTYTVHDTAFTLTENLAPQQLYYWRVRAIQEYSTSPSTIYKSEWSEIRSFTTSDGSTGSGPISVALIIDATGSMSWNDPRGMRKGAAKVFIQAAKPGDKIAVVSFTTRAYHLAALRTIQSRADKDALVAAVDQVASSGGTNINVGLNGGFAELLSDTTTNNKKAAVLLTDGRHNYSAYNPQSHLQYQAKGWPIYTVGLGSADMTLLNQIATETRGKCVNSCKPLDDPNKLQAVYFEIAQQIAGGSVIYNASIPMTQGSSEQLAISVPANQPSTTFFVGWPGSEVSTSLISPSGRQIGPATTDPDVYHAKGLTYEIYTLQAPESGQWTMDLYGTSMPAGGELVDVRVAAQSPGLTSVHLPVILKNARGASLKPTLFGTVTDNGAPVAGTEVLLRYFDGADWSTYAATSTDSNGNYHFTDPPGLGPNQSYYVRWTNTAGNPNWLWTWSCWVIIPSTTDPNAYRCNFDIDDVRQISPNHDTTVTLPSTFIWDKRSVATDDYELTLADMSNYNPWWWTESLGYVDRRTLSGLPAGFVPGQPYGWWIWAYGPDGFGTSFYYYNVTFSNSGTTSAVEAIPMSVPMSNKNLEEFPPPRSR